MKIHSIHCTFVSQSNIDKESIKKAEWLGGDFVQQVRFRLFGERYGKMLSVVVDACEKDNINILATNKINVKANYDGLSLEIEIKDIKQLENFLNRIRSHKEIESIKSV